MKGGVDLPAVGTLLAWLFLICLPIWVAGFILSGQPLAMFVLMGAISAIAIGGGLAIRVANPKRDETETGRKSRG